MKRIFLTFLWSGLSLVAKAQTGKVGINTENPKETLHINGTLQVSNLPQNGQENSIYTNAEATSRNGSFSAKNIVVADENGVLGMVSKLISYIEFDLKNVDGDWVSNFDTKIPSDKYVVIVVGGEFSANNSPYYIRVNSTDAKDAPTVDIGARIESNTWRLYADYPSSAVYAKNTKVNGNWLIKCLVIRKEFVESYGKVQEDLKGQSTKTSTITPVALTQ